MNETELKHVIAMLLEDAKRLQQVEPNAGTEIRIAQALKALDMPSNIKKETEETITVYGHTVNRQFAFYMLEKFNPTLFRIIEELTLRGLDKKSIEDATITASSAIVAGINSMMAIALKQSHQEPLNNQSDLA
ncbi:hypothetical protein ZU49_002486 [Salmonella enterica subsp. enterica]|nr:hypothetical protein [Salmonella enterica subsp. enterica]